MAEINVTPLVDVMLVLLIIFMVTAPLLTAGIPVNLPDSSAKPLQVESEPVQVSIDRDGKVYVTRNSKSQPQEVAPGEAAKVFADLKAAGDPQITLEADTALDYGRVAALMGEMGSAGLTKVSLVTRLRQ
jgi:biopolymer transport protein TolR